MVATDGSPAEYSDSGQATVGHVSEGYIYLLELDRDYEVTLRFRSIGGDESRWYLTDADSLETGLDSATHSASFQGEEYTTGPMALGSGRTAVLVEPVDGETTVEYDLDLSLASAGDGSSGDGSSGDGSTDDGSGGDNPSWFAAVGAFRAAPPDPVSAGQGDWTATDTSAFLHAIENAGAGDVIWIPGDAVVDLTGHAQLGLSSGVTVASDRNVPEGRPGGRIYVGDTDDTHLFKTSSDHLRITGLRLEGPETAWIESYDGSLSRSFGLFYGDDCEFDNCEVYGWPMAGLCHGAKSYVVSHEIHHNHFHDNLMEGLGYGVELFNGHHDIHHNYFDRCRHAISAFGYPANGYDAYYNVVGPEPLSHAFDMHATEENTSTGDETAGGTIDIRENLFQFTHDLEGRGQEAVAIRGIPDEGCWIGDNHFYHDHQPTGSGGHGDAFRQGRVSDWTNLEFGGNAYDSDLTLRPP